MKEQQSTTVTINGQVYDKATGLPVAKKHATAPTPTQTPAIKKPAKGDSARTLHATVGRSTALRRTGVRKKPVAPTAPDIIPRKAKKQPVTVARHASVTKFAATKPASPSSASQDVAPRHHPMALKAKAHARRMVPKRKAPVPAKVQKEAAIKQALDTAKPVSVAKQHKSPRRYHAKHVRIGLIVALVAVVVAVGVWLSLPAISMKVAAAQANVAASFPHFRPDGYILRMPVESKDNQVAITYVSNQNDSSFVLTQEKSSWDSQAVRASVEKLSNGQFLTTNDRGLTIYTFDGNAAWVNKGILYRITGDAKLSNDTILRIATSI